MAIFLGQRRGEQVERTGWPGLRPQASGNGYEGQDGGRECAEMEGGWSRNPFLPLLGARGGDCQGKPPLTGAAAVGGGASCVGLAQGAGCWDETPGGSGVRDAPALGFCSRVEAGWAAGRWVRGCGGP